MNTFEITITAPPYQHEGLLNADFDYIESRTVHSRYADSAATKSLSQDAARVYESVRTMMYIARLVKTHFAITRVDVCGAVHEPSVMCKLHIAHTTDRADSIIVTYINTTDSHTFDVTIAQGEKVIKNWKYPLDESGIMSYDMNFPPPSVFLDQIQRIINA